MTHRRSVIARCGAAAVLAMLALGVTPGAVAGASRSRVDRPAGTLPAVRVGLVAVSFVNRNVGFGIYEPFDPGRRTPPPRLVRTVDGGAAWHVVGPMPRALRTTDAQLLHLEFASDRVGSFYDGRSLFETTDGGRHWERPLPGTALSVAVVDGSTWAITSGRCGHVVECPPVVYRSAEPGARWRKVDEVIGAMTLGPISVAAVSRSTAYVTYWPLCDGCLAVRTAPMLVATSDGGRQWSTRSLPARCRSAGDGLVSGAADGTLFYACWHGRARDVLVYRSENGGVSWAERSDGTSPTTAVPEGRLTSLVALSADRAYILTGEDSGPEVVMTTDGGRDWARPASAPPLPVDHALLATAGRSFAWETGYGEGIWRTTDGGADWLLDPPVSAPYATRAKVRKLAVVNTDLRRMVKEQGKQNVTGAYLLETTDNKADEGSSLSPGIEHHPVYVIWITGTLSCNECRTAPGGAPGGGGGETVPAEEVVYLFPSMRAVEFGAVPALPDLPATGRTFRLHL